MENKKKLNNTFDLKKFKKRMWIFLIISAIIIAYPFFMFKYFETGRALSINLKYFLTPIIIAAFAINYFFYFKYIRLYNIHTLQTPKFRIYLEDFIIYSILTFVLIGILFGITYSTMITTNVYIGESKKTYIDETVQDFYIQRDKYGSKRKYIKFYNSNDHKIIEMQVYKEYKIGEQFQKEMKIGYWNILYSKD